MKIINKTFIALVLIVLIFMQNVIYASMADYTDEQADSKQRQEQLEWQKKHEENMNKSSNNYLKNLSVNNYNILPIFDKQTIDYKLEDEVNDEKIIITAEPDDEKAVVSNIGEILLNTGENKIAIDVTAENGMVRTYYITVIKKVSSNISLSKLNVFTKVENENIELQPQFREDIYEYNCTVENDVEEINIDAVANDENAHIDIKNGKLEDGENNVIISVYKEENEKTVYKVNIYRKKGSLTEKDNNSNYSILVVISVIVILVITLIIVFLKLNKRSRH